MKTINLHNFIGKGKNLTEARKNAIEKIEKAGAGNYQPVICCWRGMVGIVWRELDGYRYSIARPELGNTLPNKGYFTVGLYQDEAAAVADLSFALAQNAFIPGDDWAERPIILRDEKKWQEFRTWAYWQNCYKEAQQRGLSDEACRSYANAQHVPA